ncbi:transporter [Uliginosibacterium aquaticum]|uniref:Transporter n=1 Tax=Uliginosibacterium aquaticum TaxID=2731212 RepID=A0ABX2IEC0_9RHOO|nr:transporter [Uliginosibacterium aquaticum]NSL54921.1 transporter [Uliginosibacterium aquaticum]
MNTRLLRTSLIAASFATLFTAAARAEDDGHDLAKQLANPVAALISVPMQFNYDHKIGSANGERSVLNIQPVVPFSVGQEWNLISRTILPLIEQKDVAGQSGSQSGTGDIVQSLFFSPKAPTAGGMIWGVGPVFLLPTASDKLLGTEKWGAGPTAVALIQSGSWTYGGLTNHIWSFAGKESRSEVNATFLQPFVSYITPTKTTFSFFTESTYDWTSNRWSVPIHAVVSQLVKIGELPLQFTVGAHYWAQSPETGPQGWGGRAVVTLLFPR